MRECKLRGDCVVCCRVDVTVSSDLKGLVKSSCVAVTVEEEVEVFAGRRECRGE